MADGDSVREEVEVRESREGQRDRERLVYVRDVRERRTEPQPEKVRLDPKIPATFILLVAGQIFAGVWFAAQTNFTAIEQGRRLAIVEAKTEEAAKSSASSADLIRRIVSVEAKTDEHTRQINSLLLDMTQRLVRIEARLPQGAN